MEFNEAISGYNSDKVWLADWLERLLEEISSLSQRQTGNTLYSLSTKEELNNFKNPVHAVTIEEGVGLYNTDRRNLVSIVNFLISIAAGVQSQRGASSLVGHGLVLSPAEVQFSDIASAEVFYEADFNATNNVLSLLQEAVDEMLEEMEEEGLNDGTTVMMTANAPFEPSPYSNGVLPTMPSSDDVYPDGTLPASSVQSTTPITPEDVNLEGTVVINHPVVVAGRGRKGFFKRLVEFLSGK